jgi:hypothetical protein
MLPSFKLNFFKLKSVFTNHRLTTKNGSEYISPVPKNMAPLNTGSIYIGFEKDALNANARDYSPSHNQSINGA